MPGPLGTGKHDSSVKDQTSPLMATPSPPGVTYVKGVTPGQERFHHRNWFAETILGKGISFELSDAPAMCVPTTLRSISEDEMQVLAWLRKYKGEIIAAEAEFQVDRKAIAGAIAWEAIHNIQGSGFRADGPGKMHRWDLQVRPSPFSETGVALVVSDEDMWVKEVENAGLLPPQDPGDRRKLLQTPGGAIKYIGAAMGLIARIYEKNGSPGVCSPSIRLNPPVLTNEYQGSTAKKWMARVKTITIIEVLKPGNQMGLWVADPRNVQYLEDAVGSSQIDGSAASSGDAGYRDATLQESKRILEEAQKYEGTPYSYGGDSKTGIDCSHLVSRAINAALPGAKFQYIDTAGLPSSPGVRELKSGEIAVAGDIILFDSHVGFYDANPPPGKPGEVLYSARGSRSKPEPGVTWGKPGWFVGRPRYFRVRVPCQ
jgi:hypothetical protein